MEGGGRKEGRSGGIEGGWIDGSFSQSAQKGIR